MFLHNLFLCQLWGWKALSQVARCCWVTLWWEGSRSCRSWLFLYHSEAREALGFTIAVAAGRSTCLTSILWIWDSSVQVFVTARGSESQRAWLRSGIRASHLVRLSFSWSRAWESMLFLSALYCACWGLWAASLFGTLSKGVWNIECKCKDMALLFLRLWGL